MFQIRLAEPSDRDQLVEICLKTGYRGEDASHLYNLKTILGDFYITPYLESEPGLVFVLTLEGVPVGYSAAALDTRRFWKFMEEQYLPRARAQYLLYLAGFTEAEANLWPNFLAISELPTELVDRYPSHLHIDLLPAAAGKGMGRALMQILLDALADVGSPGVHLIVDAKNPRAIGFYRHFGFQEWAADDDGITMVMPFSSSPNKQFVTNS